MTELEYVKEKLNSRIESGHRFAKQHPEEWSLEDEADQQLFERIYDLLGRMKMRDR